MHLREENGPVFGKFIKLSCSKTIKKKKKILDSTHLHIDDNIRDNNDDENREIRALYKCNFQWMKCENYSDKVSCDIYIYISEIFVRIIVKTDEISTIICSFKSLQSRNCTSVRSPIALEYLRTNL